jgi:hypothetical protein
MKVGKVRAKVVARYQQYRATCKIIERLRTEKTPDARSGVIWHTQGSGKSLTMAFVIRKLRMCDDLKDFKVCLVNDRNDPPGYAHAGDYVTPEGQVPPCPLLNPNGSDQLWETCTVTDTIGEGGWSYHAGVTVRPYREQLLELVEVIAKGGNLLRGFGPTPTGEFSAANRWVMHKSVEFQSFVTGGMSRMIC